MKNRYLKSVKENWNLNNQLRVIKSDHSSLKYEHSRFRREIIHNLTCNDSAEFIYKDMILMITESKCECLMDQTEIPS